jgi:hypothetical protein
MLCLLIPHHPARLGLHLDLGYGLQPDDEGVGPVVPALAAGEPGLPTVQVPEKRIILGDHFPGLDVIITVIINVPVLGQVEIDRTVQVGT